MTKWKKSRRQGVNAVARTSVHQTFVVVAFLCFSPDGFSVIVSKTPQKSVVPFITSKASCHYSNLVLLENVVLLDAFSMVYIG